MSVIIRYNSYDTQGCDRATSHLSCELCSIQCDYSSEEKHPSKVLSLVRYVLRVLSIYVQCLLGVYLVPQAHLERNLVFALHLKWICFGDFISILW